MAVRNEYPWDSLLHPLGKTAVGYPFLDELEMWLILYKSYPTKQIHTLVKKFFPSVHKATVRSRIKKSGVKLKGPGGRHETEAYRHRGKRELIAEVKLTERICQWEHCKHNDKRLPEGRRFMHEDCAKEAEKFEI
jgi:hypothetical protein